MRGWLSNTAIRRDLTETIIPVLKDQDTLLRERDQPREMFAMSVIKRIPLVPGPSRPTVSLPERSAGCGKPGLSEREIFLMIQGIAGSVQCSDEECAYSAFMHLMRRIEGCRGELAFKARLFAEALIKAADPVQEEETNI